MYMRPRCTGMLRHLPLLTFVELADREYSMISITLHFAAIIFYASVRLITMVC